jgi:hypothetical protein
MHRGYVIVIFLLLSSLACGISGTASQVTPISTSTLPQVLNSPVPQVTNSPIPQVPSTSKPASTKAPPAQITPAVTAEEPTKTPYPTSVMDAALTSEIDQIQSQVIQERGLQPTNPVPVVLLSPDELRQNVVNDFLADYTDEEVSDDVLELSTIGLLDPNFDMRTFYVDLLSEQIAGYYDNETKEMFVVQGQGFEGPERLTYSHEYTHVLQDQNYDIKTGLKYSDDACEVDTERCAGIQALLEGDATLSQTFWYQNNATNQDKQQISDFYNSLKSPVYDSAPAFMKEDFVFPYNQGATFVQDIYSQGGWSAVDAVYKDPPVSTEQILHPNLYPSDTPIPVTLPDLTSALGEGWREVSRNQMGEWYTYLILARGVDANARLDDTTAQSAAAGWGGDNYVLLHNDATGQTAFVMKTVWDTANDAAEFASAFDKYATDRFGVTSTTQGNTTTWSYQGGVTTLYQSGDTTIWVTAPDPASVQTLTAMVQP